MIRSKWRKPAAVMLMLALITGVFASCGKEEQGQGSPGTEQQGKSGSGSTAEPDRGRYVEKEETLPEELADCAILQIFAVDGSLHLLAARQEEEKIVLQEWVRRDGSFEDVTEDWLASLEFPGVEWLEARLVQGTDGVQYLYASYMEEENYKGHLWKGQGETAENITPEKWNIPSEEWGTYETMQGIAILNNGTLAALSYSSVDILSGEDGSVLESEPISSLYDGGIVTDGEDFYLKSTSETGGQIEKWKGGKGSDIVSIPFPAGGAGDSDSIVFGGEGSLFLSVLKDGTLIAAGEDGIFRLPAGTSEDAWEKLVDGVEADFSTADCWCMGLTALEDGSIFALFQAGDKLKLNRYEFDPDAVLEITQVLNLYSLYENQLLKQAAAMYHKEHPEVLINIENEYPTYYDGTPDYDGVYKKLNTMLMGDEAPDLLVLDHLNWESYAEKGLLADLKDIVKPLEESGELLTNITGTYMREDGKQYVVPLQFGFNMALGRDIASENMSSLESLADFLSQADYSYMGTQTTAELVDMFYPYFSDEIVRDKQLDHEALEKYLGYLKTIADNCGMIDSRPENEGSYDMWDLSAQAKLAFEEVGGFVNCMVPMSMVDYIKGDFNAFEKRFVPYMQVGICAKSRYSETAVDFLKFALAQQIQDLDSGNGFPVNRKSLEVQAKKDRSSYVFSVMIMADNGEYIQFDCKNFTQETAGKLAAMCETLERPVKEDAKIRDALIQCLGGYLDGSRSLEDTIQKLEDELKMYLAE